MRMTKLRRLSVLAVLFMVGTGLLGLAQQASADPVAMNTTVDKETAAPGDLVTLTMTFTNVQSTSVQFVYQTLQPSYDTEITPGLKYAFVSCTGDAKACTGMGPQSGEFPYTMPVAPGDTRTVNLTYQIAPDSSCGGMVIDFYYYLYYEYNGGANTDQTLNYTPNTTVLCPPSS